MSHADNRVGRSGGDLFGRLWDVAAHVEPRASDDDRGAPRASEPVRAAEASCGAGSRLCGENLLLWFQGASGLTGGENDNNFWAENASGRACVLPFVLSVELLDAHGRLIASHVVSSSRDHRQVLLPSAVHHPPDDPVPPHYDNLADYEIDTDARVAACGSSQNIIATAWVRFTLATRPPSTRQVSLLPRDSEELKGFESCDGRLQISQPYVIWAASS